MLEYYKLHPQYAVLIVVLIIITLFVCYKAEKAAAKHNARTKKIMDKMKEENRLKNDFAILTAELISSSDASDLFKGVAINLQAKVAAQTDMIAEFDRLNDSQKYIYAMYSFWDDSAEEGMSGFFRANTKPLTSTAQRAVSVIFDSDFCSLFEKEYDAFDDDNEEASVIQSEIEEIDKKTAPFFEDGTVCKLCGEYIKAHSDDFVR